MTVCKGIFPTADLDTRLYVWTLLQVAQKARMVWQKWILPGSRRPRGTENEEKSFTRHRLTYAGHDRARLPSASLMSCNLKILIDLDSLGSHLL